MHRCESKASHIHAAKCTDSAFRLLQWRYVAEVWAHPHIRHAVLCSSTMWAWYLHTDVQGTRRIQAQVEASIGNLEKHISRLDRFQTSEGRPLLTRWTNSSVADSGEST